MDKRLQEILNCVNMASAGVIDVGTDHGYIPINMALQGYKGKLIASDINKGPLEAARKNAAAVGMEDRIDFTLCSGLQLCPHEGIDTIVIAGMGGDTITSILDADYWCCAEGYRLILQPMTRSNVLRYWLLHNEFAITEERLVKDMGRIYQIICAEKGHSSGYTDAELYLGKCAEPNALYYEQLLQGFSRTEHAVLGMKQGSDSPALRYHLLLLAQLQEMKNDYEGQGCL